MNCVFCQYNDGKVYTSIPPQYKCSIDGAFHFGDYECDKEFVPIRHAHWIKSKDADDGYCSVCKCDMPMYRKFWEWEYFETPYCPFCGAKMDEENIK